MALNTYFKVNINRLSVHEEAIIKLSQTLRKLNAYSNTAHTDTYRNPSGVHMKLMNFYSIEFPGKGLQNYGRLDKIVYDEYVTNKAYLSLIAAKIIEAIHINELNDVPIDNDGFMEGSILEKQHKIKERNQNLVRAKKAKVLQEKGHLHCEACGFDFNDVYGELGSGYIECHHIVPLADIEIAQKTKLKDLALVCSNCHRMLHRKRPWLTIEQLREIIFLSKNR